MKPIHKNPQFVPILSSLGLHLVLLLLSLWIHIAEPFAATQEPLLQFNVKSVDTRPLLLKHTSPATNPLSKAPNRRFMRPMAQNAPKDVPVDTLVKPIASEAHEAPEMLPKRLELEQSHEDRKPAMDTILANAEGKHTQDVVQVQQKSTSGTSDIMQMVQKHRTDTSSLVQSLAKPLERIGIGEAGNVDIDPEEGMPGFTPIEGTFGNAAFDQGGGVGESRGEVLKYEPLDDFLDIQVHIYQDPKDSQKYFMIKIFAKKEAQAFKVMPKEIIFAIDASLSISGDRMEEFKRGIGKSLSGLNPDDVFNIVAFKDREEFFSKQSVKATPQTIEEAQEFVARLVASRTTDVYNALEKIVRSEPARYPSNVILISDGRPTHGVVDSRELINTVTRINKKIRPVFTYTGGRRVNRYLLDFMAYQNRAWSQYIKDRGKIGKGLVEFYSKIKDPIFLNLRYQINNLENEDIYPKSLPDFYRNAEFTLYGRYTEEQEFFMQLLGDVEGQTKELVFTRSLKEAVQGGPDIMKGYAFNKIYHLISRITEEGQKPEILKEIQELSKRYGVQTPYSPELANRD